MMKREFSSHDSYTTAVADMIRTDPELVAFEGAQTVANQTLVDIEAVGDEYAMYVTTQWTPDGNRFDPYSLVIHSHRMPSEVTDSAELGIRELAVRILIQDIRDIWDVICNDEAFDYDGDARP